MVSFTQDRLTLCGHAATEQEFRRMKMFPDRDITCKRCLKLYQAHLEKSEVKIDSSTHPLKAKA